MKTCTSLQPCISLPRAAAYIGRMQGCRAPPADCLCSCRTGAGMGDRLGGCIDREACLTCSYKYSNIYVCLTIPCCSLGLCWYCYMDQVAAASQEALLPGGSQDARGDEERSRGGEGEGAGAAGGGVACGGDGGPGGP